MSALRFATKCFGRCYASLPLGEGSNVRVVSTRFLKNANILPWTQQIRSISASAALLTELPKSASGSGTTRQASSSTVAGRRAKPQDALTRLSTWFWRGMYVLVGAAAAGSGVMYVTDPEGTTQLARDIRDDIDSRIRYFTEPSREKLLPDIRPAFPGAPTLRTLVIDLDETLVHSSYTRSSGWRVAKRPGAEVFLAYLASFYEVVIYTSNLYSYADPILDRLDPNGYVSYRLYRAETKYEKGVHVKDLSSLNRDLSRIVVIDHDAKHCKYNPENMIQVPKWTGDPSDTSFLDLIPFLESLVREDVADVREHIGMLANRPLQEALAEHSATAAARHEKENERRGLFFGSAQTASSVAPAAGGDESGAKGAAWGNLTATSKLFHPKVTEVPKEVKELQKRAQ